MKKNLITNLIFITVGIIAAVGISYAYAAWGGPLTNTYTDPSGAPTTGNTNTPLNVSSLDQIKDTSNCVDGSCGGLSLSGSFLGIMNAQFNGQVFLNGIVGGGSGTLSGNSTVQFGGTDAQGNNQPVSIAMSGGLAATSTLKGSTLVNSSGTKTLCANQAGQIVFCTIVDMCSNITGDQTAVPTGDQQNADGTCTPAPKRFLAEIPYQEYTDPNIVGNVSNGNLQYQVPPASGSGALPAVDQIGFYNGNPNVGNWIYNQIPGVQQTAFSDSGSRLIDVGESGSYVFKISSQGNVGIEGKFPSDANVIGVEFYLKVNNQWIEMDTATTAMPAEEYPVPGKKYVDFDKYFPDTSGALGTGGSGNTYKYAPYSINFQKTLQLNAGDTVDVYAFVYGYSGRNSFFDGGGVFSGGPFADGDFNNFYYSIEAGPTTFDITETPSQ